MPPPAESDAYVRCRLDTILTSVSSDEVRVAGQELFRCLVQNPCPRPTEPSSAQVQCLIAVDGECFPEIFNSLLPSEWKPHIAVANYDLRFTDVIRVVRDTLPALLFIHSNLIQHGWDAFAAYVAVSPGTRYIIMNSNWGPETIEEFRKTYAPLQISMGILNMPFTREELIASLHSALGGALPKLKDSQQVGA